MNSDAVGTRRILKTLSNSWHFCMRFNTILEDKMRFRRFFLLKGSGYNLNLKRSSGGMLKF
jgi:hypothetical protein